MSDFAPHGDRKFRTATEAHLYFHACGFNGEDCGKLVDALRTEEWAINRDRDRWGWAEGKSPEFVAAVYRANSAEGAENDYSGTDLDITPRYRRLA